MSQKEALKIFENKNIRVVWDDELQEWLFSVVDVVEALTDSKDPKDYFKKMRKREPKLDIYVGTNCPLVLMTTPTGKRRKTLSANYEQLFRIIQSIPSSKAPVSCSTWNAKIITINTTDARCLCIGRLYSYIYLEQKSSASRVFTAETEDFTLIVHCLQERHVHRPDEED